MPPLIYLAVREGCALLNPAKLKLVEISEHKLSIATSIYTQLKHRK